MLLIRLTKVVRRISLILSIVVVLYLGTGLVFHLKWKSALAACRQTRMAQGEFVEPEVFGGVLGLAFDVTNWPIYSWANVHHHGTLFATPCTHADEENIHSAGEEDNVDRLLLWRPFIA